MQKPTETRKPRHDVANLVNSGEVSQRVAAEMLGVCSATLALWRKRGFAQLPFAPKYRVVHPRLTAYLATEIEKLAVFISGRGPDHPVPA